MHTNQLTTSLPLPQLQPKPFPKDLGLNIQTLERMIENGVFENEQPEPLRHFEFIWITKGSGLMIADLQKCFIQNDIIFCLAPGQLRLLQPTENVQGFYLRLSSEYLNLVSGQTDFSLWANQYGKGWSLPFIRIDAEVRNELEEVMVKMLKEFNNDFRMRSEILLGWLRIFMIYLSRKTELHAESEGCDKDIAMFRRFTELLSRHFQTRKLVADYADEMCITPNYLNAVIKKVSGFPASYHIQQRIISEAKKKARYSGLRMKEIAYSLGFDDYAHFSKYFKNYSGMNFTDFKRDVMVRV